MGSRDVAMAKLDIIPNHSPDLWVVACHMAIYKHTCDNDITNTYVQSVYVFEATDNFHILAVALI